MAVSRLANILRFKLRIGNCRPERSCRGSEREGDREGGGGSLALVEIDDHRKRRGDCKSYRSGQRLLFALK